MTRKVVMRSPLGISLVSAGAATRPTSLTWLNGWSDARTSLAFVVRTACAVCAAMSAPPLVTRPDRPVHESSLVRARGRGQAHRDVVDNRGATHTRLSTTGSAEVGQPFDGVS